MKNIKFNYYDLKEGKVLVEVSYINRDFFNSEYLDSWCYNNINYEVGTYRYKSKGNIDLEFNENNKLDSITLYIGESETYSIIPKKYVYIFEDLEEKVYNIKEKKILDVLDIKEGDYYYFVNYDDYNNKFYIDEEYNYEFTEEINSGLLGNVFKTKESAEDFIKELEKLFIERKQKLLEVG